MFRKIRSYNSRNYNLENEDDFNEFFGLKNTLMDFDFAIYELWTVHAVDFDKANIHVKTKNKTMEIWLIKHGFKEET